ncbi:MAG: hypothetical protein K6F09_03520 [Clostridiales bacterium]|nr:hypothetical protein [Clostridiales bacterium]
MKKTLFKTFSLFLAAVMFVSAFTVTSYADGDEPGDEPEIVIIGFEVSKLPNKTEYVYGIDGYYAYVPKPSNPDETELAFFYDIDITGLELKVNYSDGTTKTAALDGDFMKIDGELVPIFVDEYNQDEARLVIDGFDTVREVKLTVSQPKGLNKIKSNINRIKFNLSGLESKFKENKSYIGMLFIRAALAIIKLFGGFGK